MRTILAFEYQGRRIYPLIESPPRNCAPCLFRPASSEACRAVTQAMPHGTECQAIAEDLGYYWAEGEAAALQYLTERLLG